MQGEFAGMNWNKLKNPILEGSDNLRDPAVLKVGDTWHLYYTRYSNADWYRAENWSVARVMTKDWIRFDDDRDITPKGYASPGDIVFWQGRWILPFESYPIHPSGLCFAQSSDLTSWSEPVQFLSEALQLPWNTYARAIDPTLVVHGDYLYCYFTASLPGLGNRKRANGIGLARTKDPNLQGWEMLSKDQPLLGPSPDYPDGVENLAILKSKTSGWSMYYSAGLKNQRIARMDSEDLVGWHKPRPIVLEDQWWCTKVQGAPGFFTHDNHMHMIIMGADDSNRTRFGLARQTGPETWKFLPAGARVSRLASDDLPF
jgi:sucrose-6-phosphate hydrolase SacC (GH32 family)